MSLVQTVAPAVEPLDIADVKLHLRVTHDEENDKIHGLIQHAREQVEAFCNRQLITATWVLKCDWFPSVIYLLRGDIQTVASVAYTDTAGASQTLVDGTDYATDLTSEPGRIVPYFGETWPSTQAVMDAVVVTYTVGYGTAANDVPFPIRQTMLNIIGWWYEQRGGIGQVGMDFATGWKVTNAAFETALMPYRMMETA